MKTNTRPIVFIGSSSEGLKIAKALQQELDHFADVEIWSQGVFGLSSGTLETLCEQAETFDFAILVLTPDDMLSKRDSSMPAPRDNVVFELGLFMGILGRKRTYIVHQRGIDISLPTDLAGITPTTFRMQKSGNLRASIGAAATQIANEIETIGIVFRSEGSRKESEKEVKNTNENEYNGMADVPDDSSFFIQPTDNRLIAKMLWPEQTTKGGIRIPKSAMERPTQGTVVATGNEVQRIKAGDKILWNKYAGLDMNIEGEEYIMVREDDIIGVVK